MNFHRLREFPTRGEAAIAARIARAPPLFPKEKRSNRLQFVSLFPALPFVAAVSPGNITRVRRIRACRAFARGGRRSGS
jgi:hypothetical protein